MSKQLKLTTVGHNHMLFLTIAQLDLLKDALDAHELNLLAKVSSVMTEDTTEEELESIAEAREELKLVPKLVLQLINA